MQTKERVAMTREVENGYLVLADISGFDAYLADVELEHAQDVLKELLELIVDHLGPLLELSTVERDAVLTYTAGDRVTRGETILELIETTYVAFRDRLTSISRNNTCHCRACVAIPTLDLKFLVHYGEYTVEHNAGRGAELGGLEANLVRERLLKDQMSGDESWRAYLLFTEQSLEQLGFRPEGMRTGCASYPHLGEIKTAALDLRPRYKELTDARRTFVRQEDADLVITCEFDTSPIKLWEWLNDPARRTRWLRWTRWRPGLRPGGRTGVGSMNHCAHSIGSLVETVLDWRPYDYFTAKWVESPGSISFLMTYELQPLANGNGTRLHLRSSLQKGAADWLMRRVFKWVMPRKLSGDLANLAQMIAAEEAEP
jgi:uncharacterized protein YndB with AHSA1/START domain